MNSYQKIIKNHNILFTIYTIYEQGNKENMKIKETGERWTDHECRQMPNTVYEQCSYYIFI